MRLKPVWLAAGALIIAVAAVVYFEPWSAGRPGADAEDAGLVALGRGVYAGHCAACHGVRLEGQPDWRSPLDDGGYPAPPHDADGHTWHHADSLLFAITRDGGQKAAPEGFKSNMPGFAAVLSERDIWAVLAFIKSRWPEEIRARHSKINARSG